MRLVQPIQLISRGLRSLRLPAVLVFDFDQHKRRTRKNVKKYQGKKKNIHRASSTKTTTKH